MIDIVITPSETDVPETEINTLSVQGACIPLYAEGTNAEERRPKR